MVNHKFNTMLLMFIIYLVDESFNNIYWKIGLLFIGILAIFDIIEGINKKKEAGK